MIKIIYTALFILLITCLSFAQDDCTGNELSVVKDKFIDIRNFEHKHAYGNYNETYNSYRAIFINYDRSIDSDFRNMEGGQIKVVIMIFTKDKSKLTPGTYILQRGDDIEVKNISVAVMSSKGTNYITSINGDYVGSVEIYKVDDEILCGFVDIMDSNGMTVTGNFSVKNMKVN